MASNYPASLDALATNHADGVSEVIHAATLNDDADAINKIETELGVNTSGLYTNVTTRLNTLETLVTNHQGGAAYTLALSDASKVVNMFGVGSNVVTVPTNASVAFPLGVQILLRCGQGSLAVAAAVGVTVQSRGSSLTLAGQYAWATLVQTAANVWDLFGDLA